MRGHVVRLCEKHIETRTWLVSDNTALPVDRPGWESDECDQKVDNVTHGEQQPIDNDKQLADASEDHRGQDDGRGGHGSSVGRSRCFGGCGIGKVNEMRSRK